MATRNKTKFKNNWFTKLKKPKGVSESYMALMSLEN